MKIIDLVFNIQTGGLYIFWFCLKLTVKTCFPVFLKSVRFLKTVSQQQKGWRSG